MAETKQHLKNRRASHGDDSDEKHRRQGSDNAEGNQRNYTLVDIQDTTVGLANRPNTRSNDRKSRQANVQKSNASHKQQNSQGPTYGLPQSANISGDAQTNQLIMDKQNSGGSYNGGRKPSIGTDASGLVMINELSAHNMPQGVAENQQWEGNSQQHFLVAQGDQNCIQVGQGILAASGEANKNYQSKSQSQTRQQKQMQNAENKPNSNSNLRKRNPNGSSHRVSEPRSAKQQKRTDADKNAEVLGTPNLGQNLQHTRGPSMPVYSSGAPLHQVASGQQDINQNQNSYFANTNPQTSQEAGAFNTSSQFASINSSNTTGKPNVNMVVGQTSLNNNNAQDYQSQGFGFVNGTQSNQLPSTFQFTQPGSASSTTNFNPQGNFQQQPQVHFIAKQQKFYGISPERAQQLMFNTGAAQLNIQSMGVNGEKRPYTAENFKNTQLPHATNNNMSAQPSGTAVFNKRQQNIKAQQQQQMMAALYLGGSTVPKGQQQPMLGNFMSEPQASRKDQPFSDFNLAQGGTQQPKKLSNRLAGILGAYSQQQHYTSAVPRRSGTTGGLPIHKGEQARINQREQEQLYEELIKMKQMANGQREENIKLKTKNQVLEKEMQRKERTIEDFFQQSQFIAQNQNKGQGQNSVLSATTESSAQRSNGGLVPQTAQRYQQETFLVMSLKKQIKELKSDILRRDEEISLNKRNVRHTKFYEMESEIKLYKEELARLRFMLEQSINSGTNSQFQATGNTNLHTQDADPEIKGNGTRATNSAFGPAQQNSKQLAELKNSFSEPPTNHLGQGPLSELDQTGIPAKQELNSMSEQVEIMSQTQQNFGGASLIVPPPTNNQGTVQAKSAINKATRIDPQEKRELQEKQKELKNQLTSVQKENSSLSEKAKLQVKELTRVKKLLKDKEQEISKFKQQDTIKQSSAKAEQAAKDEETQKLKSLQSQVSRDNQRAAQLKIDLKAKEEEIEKLGKEIASEKTKSKSIAAQHRKEQGSAIKSLEQVIEALQKELKQKDEALADKDKTDAVDTKKVQVEAPTQAAPKMDNNDKIELERKQKEIEKELQIKQLHGETLDELSLLAEQVCYISKADRIECAELLHRAINQPKSIIEGTFKELGSSVSDQVKELVSLIPVSELACMLPKCRSSFLTKEDRKELLEALEKNIQPATITEILKDEKAYISVSLAKLKQTLNCDKQSEFVVEGEMPAEIAYRLVQILYFNKFAEGKAQYNVGLLANDIFELKSAQVENKKTPEEKDELAEKSVVLDQGNADEESKGENLSMGLSPRDESKDSESKRRNSLDDERMLDVAEGCFIRLAELLLDQGRTIRGIFTKFSQPEIFPDQTVLELLSPMSFLAGVRESGFHDLQEVEAACLMKVLAKPELENHIILNELALIMENFGVLDNLDQEGEDEEEDDYVPDTDSGDESKETKKEEEIEIKEETKDGETDTKDDKTPQSPEKKMTKSKLCDKVRIDAKGQKILTKLARFLLKQFVHPREFFGQSIKKEKITTKRKTAQLDVLTFKDFYLRIKIASIRKKLTPNESLNNELCIDKKKYTEFIHVKSMVRILEEIAEAEQEIMIKEEEAKKAEDKLNKKDTIEGSLGSDDPDTPKTEESKKSIDKDSGEKRPPRNAPLSRSEDSMDRPSEKLKKASKSPTGSKSDYSEAGEMNKFGFKDTKEPPMSAGRGYKRSVARDMQLGTIEEDKAETQTSNYQQSQLDGQSDRDDSKLNGSTNLRGSHFLQDGELGIDDSGDHRQMQRSLNNISEGGDRTKQSAQKSIQFNNDSEGKDEKSEDGQIHRSS